MQYIDQINFNIELLCQIKCNFQDEFEWKLNTIHSGCIESADYIDYRDRDFLVYKHIITIAIPYSMSEYPSFSIKISIQP